MTPREVTSDNPRSEDPLKIIGQVLDGIPVWSRSAGTEKKMAESFVDRQVAIFSAVHQARRGDVLLVAGKGHETYQEIAGTRVPFNDREVARMALDEWGVA